VPTTRSTTLGGTDGSNPLSSSGESANHRFLAEAREVFTQGVNLQVNPQSVIGRKCIWHPATKRCPSATNNWSAIAQKSWRLSSTTPPGDFGARPSVSNDPYTLMSWSFLLRLRRDRAHPDQQARHPHNQIIGRAKKITWNRPSVRARLE
jgi:hypothetical protein